MKIFLIAGLIFLITSCANIVAPSGGDKDIEAPEILSTLIKESLSSVDKKTIVFEFNEYVQFNNWNQNFYISPPIENIPTKKINGQTLFVTIDEMLKDSITYYISLNSCVKDNNEGNILDTLSFKFWITDNFDTLTLSGNLQDSYTLNPLSNSWVMLFNKNVDDTLIFKELPNYVAKTNKDGFFHFPNLRDEDYKIVALTNFDFIYNNEEKIAFKDSTINPRVDSFISLFAFDPIISQDLMIDSSRIKLDSITEKSIENNGKLEIITNQHTSYIFQLLQDEKVIHETYFSEKPYLIEGIIAGNYQLRYIDDINNDSIWNTGSWDKKIQPEQVSNYPAEITIRSNWDLAIEWIIE